MLCRVMVERLRWVSLQMLILIFTKSAMYNITLSSWALPLFNELDRNPGNLQHKHEMTMMLI
jgi:hypothetical protein